jgi:chlorite dismutase
MGEARNYVKYTFLKIDPAWRRRTAEERAADKGEFAAACSSFGEDHYLRAYSLVGTRGDCDLMIRAICRSIEPIHELHVLLNQSGLMRYAQTPHSYLAITKESPYSDQPEQPLAPREGADSKYLIVYPMWKKRSWYGLAPEERMRVMEEHIAVARRFGGIETNTAYSFGLDDQEFVVAFDADDPAEFLDLVQELRSTESSAYTESETPIFTCLRASVEGALEALDGERAVPASPRSPGERQAAALTSSGTVTNS